MAANPPAVRSPISAPTLCDGPRICEDTKKASAPRKVKLTVEPGATASKKFTVKTKKRKTGKVKITAKLGQKTAKTVLKLRK